MSASHTPLSERDLELLSAYLDGALTDREQRALEQRLAHDNTLRTEMDHLRDTVALVRELPRLKAPRQFTLDPAVYGRKVPWWQRVLPLETVLQLSGALGAAASLVIIILAVALSSRSGTKQAEVQPAAGNEAAFAITNAEPTSLATLLTAEGTSIAYGGEGLFQATMAMQSTFYAGTPAPSATAVPNTAPLVLIPTGTPTPSSGMVAEAQAGLHAGPSEETSMADNIPMTEPELAAQPSAVEAPTLPSGSAPAVLGAAEAGSALPGVPLPPAGAEGQTGAAAAPQAVNPAGGAFREGADNETQVTLEPAYSATPTQPTTPTPEPALDQAVAATEMALPTTPPESPVFSAPGPTEIPAPLEVAQAPPAGGSTFKAGAERRAAEQGETHNLWWLAGLGVVTLVISAGLFMVGRRKARRA
jgi:hypothetical protein